MNHESIRTAASIPLNDVDSYAVYIGTIGCYYYYLIVGENMIAALSGRIEHLAGGLAQHLLLLWLSPVLMPACDVHKCGREIKER